MKLERCFYTKKLRFLFFIPLIILFNTSPAFSYPVEFIDSQGNKITINDRPSQVVSLVPSITEIIFKIGAGDAVKAITYHDTYPSEATTKEIVGGFFSPSLKTIEAMRPDVIFYSHFHKQVKDKFGHGKSHLVNLETDSIADSYKNIHILGRIFNKEDEVEKVIDRIKSELQIITKKVVRIPQPKRKRVIRLMGREEVMTPGDDSFQNEIIRSAGGIPPELGKKGNIVVVTKEEWMRFNPQVIYGCGGDRETARKFFDRPGWKENSFLVDQPRSNILVIHSLTKFYALAGLGLGGIVGTEEVISKLREKKEPWTVNGVADYVAPLLLECADYEHETRSKHKAEHERISRRLDKLEGFSPFPSYTNFILCQWDKTKNLDDLMAHLLSNGAYVRDCRNFPGLEKNFFRICLRSPNENNRLISILSSFPG